MADHPLPIRLAQTLGLTTTLLFAGANISLSMILVPQLLKTPSRGLLLRQWFSTYYLGKAVARPSIIISSLSYLYLAYHTHVADPTNRELDWKVWSYVASAVLIAGIAPYTMTVMGRTNGRLMELEGQFRGLSVEEEEKVGEAAVGEETAHSLVDWWGVLNLGRGAMVAVSGVLGLWATLN